MRIKTFTAKEPKVIDSKVNAFLKDLRFQQYEPIVDIRACSHRDPVHGPMFAAIVVIKDAQTSADAWAKHVDEVIAKH